MRSRFRRREPDQTAEETGRLLEDELAALRDLTDSVATKADSVVQRITQIVKETRA